MIAEEVLSAALRRDRQMVAGAITIVIALAWLYLFEMAAMTPAMDSMALVTQPRPWTFGYGAMMFVMWAVMMVAMMLPSALPMLLIHARMCRQQQLEGRPYAPSSLFAAGYLAVWTLYSAGATLLQWGLDTASLLSPMMVSNNAIFGGAVLIVAGAYQLTPFKEICLHKCQSPFGFLAQHWQPEGRGAFKMGLSHGGYCVGCCWALMALLFVGGVMNLIWIAAITVFVLVEKAIPMGNVFSRIWAGLFMLFGITVIAIG
jgi:predicted metal-binding membrane protein